MQTALLHHKPAPKTGETSGHPSSSPGPQPKGWGVPAAKRTADLDTLLRADVLAAEGAVEAQPFIEIRQEMGVFLGLRTVLFLYLGTGIAAGLAYETWSLLAR